MLINERAAVWVRRILIVAGVVVVWLLLLKVIEYFDRPPVNTTVAVETPAAAPVKRIPKVRSKMTVPPLVYEDKAKKALSLPPEVIADPDKSVLSATTIHAGEHSTTATTVLNLKTGESTTFQKEEPYPWLAVENRGEARIDVGKKFGKGMAPVTVGRFSVSGDFIQSKGFHAGLSASIDTDGSGFAGGGLGWRW